MITVNNTSDYPKPLSDKDKALVEAIYSYVNNGNGISPLMAGKELSQIHRALHSSLLKLFVGWCRQMAIDHYKERSDERNRAISKQIAEIYDFMVENRIVNDPSYITETL